MAALTAAKPNPSRVSSGPLSTDIHAPMATGVTIYAGALVSVAATGYARPARTSTTDLVLGVAQETKANAGADGAASIAVKRGVYKFANSAAGDAISAAHVGRDVFIVDDQTVAATNGTNTRVRAGKCVGVDSDGVWVETY
jgi:hypothetical protein